MHLIDRGPIFHGLLPQQSLHYPKPLHQYRVQYGKQRRRWPDFVRGLWWASFRDSGHYHHRRFQLGYGSVWDENLPII